MISVEEAKAQILALVKVLPPESIPLREAHGRVLARAAIAARNQPPFDTSMMDGYAIGTTDLSAGTCFKVIGEAAAGRRFEGQLGAGQAVRIFTGAPLPMGAKRVVIQEDVTRVGPQITINAGFDTAPYIRAEGADFAKGARFEAPRQLASPHLALLAAMNCPVLEVYRRPEVALIATGDELVMPGERPGRDQIIASNAFGLAAQIEAAGGIARILPIARDSAAALHSALDLARGADLIVTIGGASVGDHDLVGRVSEARGMERAFWKVAMRPGKPLMAGRLEGTPLIGLPGNPVSALVCGLVFLRPALRKMQGLATGEPLMHASLSEDLGANGPRAHFMRAQVSGGEIAPFASQDSALLGLLGQANALLIRPAGDAARPKGSAVAYLPL